MSTIKRIKLLQREVIQDHPKLEAAAGDLLDALRAYEYAGTLPYGDPLHRSALADADFKRRYAIVKATGGK